MKGTQVPSFKLIYPKASKWYTGADQTTYGETHNKESFAKSNPLSKLIAHLALMKQFRNLTLEVGANEDEAEGCAGQRQ
jgi:hypothetical protein